MAIPQGFRNVLGIATPVCGLVRNDRGVSKQTDKSEFEGRQTAKASLRKVGGNLGFQNLFQAFSRLNISPFLHEKDPALETPTKICYYRFIDDDSMRFVV